MSERGQVRVLPDDLALLPPGPALGFLLTDVDRAALDDGDLVRLAQARQRLVSHLQAQLLSDLHAIGQRCDTAIGADPARGRWAEVEIAFALRWTSRAAANQLGLADDLCDRLPAVHAALNTGVIDVPKARVFADVTCGLDTPLARQVADQVLDQAGGWTTGQLRARLQRLVLAADPQAAARRAKQAITGRRVQARLTDAGSGELCGHDLPPERVAAAMERLTAIARAAKNDGDTRRIDQLRADVLLDLLVGDGIAAGDPITNPTSTAGQPDHPQHRSQPPHPFESENAEADAVERDVVEGEGVERDAVESDAVESDAVERDAVEGDDGVDPDHAELAALYLAGFDQLPTTRPQPATDRARGAMPGPRKGVIELQVPLTTLLGLAEHPGDLGGWGPVVADIARQVVAQQADATWRFSVYDQLGELAVHGITRRRPTAEDAAFIKARDRTCRAPGCRMPARLCDIDHTRDWALCRDSRRCNLAALCVRHHVFKHLPGSDLTQIIPGVLGWTTPLGLQYITTPATYFDDSDPIANVPPTTNSG
jgi:hypothetical protein